MFVREAVDSCNGSIPLRIENGWDAEQESGGGTSGSGVAGDGILPDHAWAAGEAGEPSGTPAPARQRDRDTGATAA